MCINTSIQCLANTRRTHPSWHMNDRHCCNDDTSIWNPKYQVITCYHKRLNERCSEAKVFCCKGPRMPFCWLLQMHTADHCMSSLWKYIYLCEGVSMPFQTPISGGHDSDHAECQWVNQMMIKSLDEYVWSTVFSATEWLTTLET